MYSTIPVKQASCKPCIHLITTIPKPTSPHVVLSYFVVNALGARGLARLVFILFMWTKKRMRRAYPLMKLNWRSTRSTPLNPIFSQNQIKTTYNK